MSGLVTLLVVEQGETAVPFDRFVADGSDLPVKEEFGEPPVGGQVEVSKEGLPLPEESEFLRYWLFNLYDQPRRPEDIPAAQDIGVRLKIIDADWLPGGDELTPTMKLKRKPILQKYAAQIEQLYAG